MYNNSINYYRDKSSRIVNDYRLPSEMMCHLNEFCTELLFSSIPLQDTHLLCSRIHMASHQQFSEKIRFLGIIKNYILMVCISLLHLHIHILCKWYKSETNVICDVFLIIWQKKKKEKRKIELFVNHLNKRCSS